MKSEKILLTINDFKVIQSMNLMGPFAFKKYLDDFFDIHGGTE